MSIDQPPRPEQAGENRKKLLALEETGRFVFHGSPDVLSILEPRQATNYNEETGENEEHGGPAVCATTSADVAIFRALINESGVIGDLTSKFGMNDDGLHFSASQNLIDQARLKIGKVYVLDKQKFSHFEGMEERSGEAVVPVEIVEVSFADLPTNIKLIE